MVLAGRYQDIWLGDESRDYRLLLGSKAERAIEVSFGTARE